MNRRLRPSSNIKELSFTLALCWKVDECGGPKLFLEQYGAVKAYCF